MSSFNLSYIFKLAIIRFCFVFNRSVNIIIFHILIELTTSISLNKNDDIDDIAITIIIIGDINPALTAASPSTRAPTIEMDVPKALGILVSASLKSSNVNIRSNASIMEGNGTPDLWILKFMNIEVGNVSGLNVVKLYNAKKELALKLEDLMWQI